MSNQILIDFEALETALKAAKVTASGGGKDADPTLSTVYLHSTRRPSQDGPGESDVLVFTSYDMSSVGQYAVEVEGQLDHPVLLPVANIATINSTIKLNQKRAREQYGKEAELKVRLSLGSNAAGSETLSVTTLTDGAVGKFDDTYNQVLDPNVDLYPIDDAMIYLCGVETDTVRDHNGAELPEGAALAVSSSQSKVMDGIQKVFKDFVVFCYPLGHMANRRILTCGTWRGSVPGATYDPDADLNTPEIDVLVPSTSEVAPAEGVKPRRTGDSELADAAAHVETLV
jgi:hypothetical protein